MTLQRHCVLAAVLALLLAGCARYHKVYEVRDTPVGSHALTLKGLFDAEPREHAAGRITMFATPVRVGWDGHLGIDHFTWYELERPAEPEPQRTVFFENMFGEQIVLLGQPRFLVLPSEKVEEGSRFPDASVYKCYEVLNWMGSSHPVELEDQFDVADGDTDNVEVGACRFLCVPAVTEAPWFVRGTRGEAVYDIKSQKATARQVQVIDRFHPNKATLSTFRAQNLCATSTIDEWVQVPTGPDRLVETYAILPGPVMMSFDPSTGDLYVGHDSRYTGGGALSEASIRRIGAGGSPIDEVGAAAADPDAVLFDSSGAFGTQGAVLVGGRAGTSISRVWPGTKRTFFVPDEGEPPILDDPADLAFDSTGRLLVADSRRSRVYHSSGPDHDPRVLFAISTPTSIAVDAADRVYAAGAGGQIQVHDAAGTLLATVDSTSSGQVAIAVGPGGAWGDDLYVLKYQDSGELLRFDIEDGPFRVSGTPTVVCTGFTIVTDFRGHDLEFGPDGALYVSEHRIFESGLGRILRVSVP